MVDRAKYAEWAALLEAAEAAQGIPLIPHNDLPDALAAYRHFLYGKGADRTFWYERYVASDASGKTTLANAILDLRRGVRKTALFVTHDIREAMMLASRIALLKDGALDLLAAPREFQAADTPEARAFLACLEPGPPVPELETE